MGTGSLANVPLDTWALNELLESVDVPLCVLEGFICSISLSVPWASLLTDPCCITIQGLKITCRPHPRSACVVDWSGLMSSSLQMARECLSDQQGEQQPLEGLETFAHTIETVLRRVRVTFLDTVLRVEHVPEHSKTGVAMELRISRMEYQDQLAEEGVCEEQQQQSVCVQKSLRVEGLTLYWDQFPHSARTGLQTPPTHTDSDLKLSPSWDPHIVCEPHPQFTTVTPLPPSPPSQIAMGGALTLSLLLRQSQHTPAAKLEVSGVCESLVVLLSPRQVHLLMDMMDAFTHSAGEVKSRPMGREDEYRLHMELQRCLRKETMTTSAMATQRLATNHTTTDSQTTKTSREDVFFSMAEVMDMSNSQSYQPAGVIDMSHSLSSLPPLGDPPTVDLDLSISSNYSGQSPPARWDEYLEVNQQQHEVQHTHTHPTLLRQTSHEECVHPELVLRVCVERLLVAVLHIDPLPPADSAHSAPAPMAAHFFHTLNTATPTHAFLQSRDLFDKALPHDHLRLVGEGVSVSYEHTHSSSVRRVNSEVSFRQMDIRECLFSTETHTHTAQYTELLVFDEDESELPHCLQLSYRLTQRRGPQGGRRRADVCVELSSCRSEFDISIVDRLHSLLQPRQHVTMEMMTSHMYTSHNKPFSLHKAFAEVFLDEGSGPGQCEVCVCVSAPRVRVCVRFPIPDLRCDAERGAWFRRRLRPDTLTLEITEPTLNIHTHTHAEHTRLELHYRLLTADLHSDGDEEPISFLRVSPSLEESSTMESGKFDWPRVVCKINPPAVSSLLERGTLEEEEEEEGEGLREEEASHSLKDVCDFSQPEPSPFSSRRVMYENEEMVIPGDVREMNEFQEKTSANSRFTLELTIPQLHIHLPDKAFYQRLHNRINNDLLLWEPTAPSPVETAESLPYGGISVASQLINTHTHKDNSPEEEESESEEDVLGFPLVMDAGSRRRKRRAKSHRHTHTHLHTHSLSHTHPSCQSLLSVSVTVNQGSLSLHTHTQGVCGKSVCTGAVWLEVQGAGLFGVSHYQGLEDQHYLCCHTHRLGLYHSGQGSRGEGLKMSLADRKRPDWLEPTLLPDSLNPSEPAHSPSTSQSGGLGAEQSSMLSAAVKMSSATLEQPIKKFLVAVGIRGVTLHHRVVPSGRDWYQQLLDFLSVQEEEVLGYTPPPTIITTHTHLWNCSMDYRPLYMPVRSLITVETFSISRSLASDLNSSTVRIIIDEVALYLSEKNTLLSVNLARDYVRVVEMGTLELRIRTACQQSNGEQFVEPRLDVRCSGDVLRVRVCWDSCAALMKLLQYVAMYGDLQPPRGPEQNYTTGGLLPPSQPEGNCVTHGQSHRSSTSSHQSQTNGGVVKAEELAPPPSQSALLPDEVMLQELMRDAMEEDTHMHTHTQGLHGNSRQEVDAPLSDLFLFPDESGNILEPSPCSPVPLPSPLIPHPNAPPLPHDDFCILHSPATQPGDGEPVVRVLSKERIELKENHFNAGATRASLLHTPDTRYLFSISLILSLYGGRDFSPGCSPSHAPHHLAARGAAAGAGRNTDMLMEIQLNKVRVQHEVFPPPPEWAGPERASSRQLLVVQEVEIRDRLASSQINKFLYLYTSDSMPRRTHSNMVTVRAVHVSVAADESPDECCLRVSLMPLRLNIDQDALFFLRDFFSSLAAEVELFSPPDHHALCVSMKRTAGSESSSSHDPAPIISTANQNGRSEQEHTPLGEKEHAPSSFSDQPIFFREFRFTSDVPIRLDYHGKHVAMEQGTFAGILMGLAQLNCSELTLRRLCYRQGLLGVDRLVSYALHEWISDIKRNQLPGLLGGVGPIHSLLQLAQGCRDLFWLPIQQYRVSGLDGRIVRGVQRGSASFGTSTAMATLELTNRMLRTIQAAAETAYDMVSVGGSGGGELKRYSRHRLAQQPVDLREGVAKAYSVVKEGLTDTAVGIIVTATREHEQRGVSGAVGGVIREIPPAVVTPIVIATAATAHVLEGMRNQIHPHTRQEEEQKWRHAN
ncbi:autophagy-related protein 2 homolog B-like isoform X2 [Engraulis encrasicolus]